MAKHHAFVVKWRDSAANRGWRSIDDPAHDEVAEITSVGWLVRQTPRTISLTTSISGQGNVMDTLSIPRECITKMQRLKNYIVGE
jgi:hypothetical protein